jgi:peptidoglycan/LPS O-acetylase OafA/YrhL
MIKPLTSLRFFFALMVFASHLSFFQNSHSENLKWIFLSIMKEGYLGVSFFFILSGFILAYNYQGKFLIKNYPVKQFYIARFARIYPLHFLTFLISIPFIYGSTIFSDVLIFKSITNLTLTQSFIPIKGVYFSFNAPSWSISNEMFFYLLFPFIVGAIYALKKKWYILLIIFSLIPIASLLIPSDYYHQLFYINPIARIFDFAIGLSLYNLYVHLKTNVKTFNYNYLEISAVVLFIIFFYFHSDMPKVSRYSFYYWLPMSLIIIAFSFQKGFISKFLSHKLFIYLGEISFGIYMYHHLVMRYFKPLNAKFLGIENDLFSAALILIISLLVSHWSFKYFETPMNSYLKRRFN